jgi:hypothetical protein
MPDNNHPATPINPPEPPSRTVPNAAPGSAWRPKATSPSAPLPASHVFTGSPRPRSLPHTSPTPVDPRLEEARRGRVFQPVRVQRREPTALPTMGTPDGNGGPNAA